MSEGPGVVLCGCNNHPTTDTVRISTDKKSSKNTEAVKRSENKTQITGKIEKENRLDKVHAKTVIK